MPKPEGIDPPPYLNFGATQTVGGFNAGASQV